MGPCPCPPLPPLSGLSVSPLPFFGSLAGAPQAGKESKLAELQKGCAMYKQLLALDFERVGGETQQRGGREAAEVGGRGRRQREAAEGGGRGRRQR